MCTKTPPEYQVNPEHPLPPLKKIPLTPCPYQINIVPLHRCYVASVHQTS